MVIRELTELDLPFLLEIRNHKSTRVNLEDDSIFDIDQCTKWFKTLTTPWFIIEVNNKPVGYIRVKDDLIGIDIHMDFRKKGYAKQAFKEYFPTYFQILVGSLSPIEPDCCWATQSK